MLSEDLFHQLNIVILMLLHVAHTPHNSFIFVVIYCVRKRKKIALPFSRHACNNKPDSMIPFRPIYGTVAAKQSGELPNCLVAAFTAKYGG